MLIAAAAFAVTGLIFLGLDVLWLTTMAPVYKRMIGEALVDPFRLTPAAIFYLLYVTGIVGFVVLPALQGGGWPAALAKGAFLGLVAYGTYDLSNQATLKIWPVSLTMMDMAWGVFLTSTTAALSTALLGRIFHNTL